MTKTNVKSTSGRGKSKGKHKDRAQPNGWLTARTSDRYELYENSVQEPEAECDLIDQIWSEQRGRRCDSIREDFCGSAAVAMEWLKRRRSHTAIGVDLDPEVLKWARQRIASRLTREQATRLQLIESDVMTVQTAPVDSILAMNFSYYLLHERSTLRQYFERAHAGLKEDGLFLLDAYGGSDSFLEQEEERELDGFTYIWDQHSYNPITGLATNYIHFTFPDGSEIRKAFKYKWRLWTLPEIREILAEAGFRKSVVYWEGTDEETEEGNGEWRVSRRGEACLGWVAYIVAIK